MSRARIDCQKWPSDPHWTFPATRLGEDDHGVWVGIERGTVMVRPGLSITAVADHVTLVPYDEWWLATFYGNDPVVDAQRPFDAYVDIATPAWWQQEDGLDVARAVDLDLDVIRGTTGRVWVDDEDEFAEHRVSRGYPRDVVEHAMEACTSVLRSVQSHEPPFDLQTSRDWLTTFRYLLGRSAP